MTTLALFHHTNTEGMKGILKAGKINESRTNGVDARFGRGVYLTSLGPDKSAKEVAKNNFDGLAEDMLKEGRGDIIIKVIVHEDKIQKADSARDIYIHSGDIPTSKIKHLYRRKDGKILKYTIQKK